MKLKVCAFLCQRANDLISIITSAAESEFKSTQNNTCFNF